MNSNRIRILLCLLCLVAIAISAKLYLVQIVSGEEYARQADRQYVKSSSAVFERGSIFFETKEGVRVGVATVKTGYTLVMNPKLVKDPARAYEALSQYFHDDFKIDKDVFMKKAVKQNDQYEELHRKLDRNTGITFGELAIPGVSVNKESWRVYPGGEMAAHIIGLVGYDAKGDLAGRYGLERYYEKTLSKLNRSSSINFFAELFANIKGDITSAGLDSERREGDVVAGIDPAVESELEKILAQTQASWKSDSIGGIIMDPKTGQIYAMASHPSFDPNNLKDVSDPHIFSNQLVEGIYEMGSIIKPLTMAAGIDAGVITPESTYDDPGFLLLNGKRIANYDGRARGVISMQEVLSQSLNIGAATVALKVGSENFSRYLLSFGLGENSGIDQPNEQRGKMKNLKSGREIEQATASYGQGISMSPIVTIRALSIIANGGNLVRPHIAKEINYSDGEIKKINYGTGVRVIQKKTADQVTSMLVEVVDKTIAKAHPGIRMERYSIAAKTGTAQIADPVNGGYYSDRYLHSFFGYFPAYNPRYIVFLYHIYPKGANYASETLIDPFIELTNFLIKYYEIPPDR